MRTALYRWRGKAPLGAGLASGTAFAACHGMARSMAERFARAKRDLRRVESAPFVGLGRPTPVEVVDLAGRMLLVKRDDLSGFGRGGAKARKLSHLFGWMKARGADTLITAAGNVTNLGFDLVKACDDLDVRLELFIVDDPPLAPALRQRIFSCIDERVTLLGTSRGRLLSNALATYHVARARGRAPMLVLPGVSHPSAVVGNACGFLEMARSLLVRNEPLPDAVFVTAATGTTLAGLLLGASVLEGLGFQRIRVLGAKIYPGPTARHTLALIRWTERAFGLETAVPRGLIEISGTELGDGFGHFGDRLISLCDEVTARYGFCIDPIFGGKTWAAMRACIEREHFERPLYWHCGFTPEWRLFRRSLDARRREAA